VKRLLEEGTSENYAIFVASVYRGLILRRRVEWFIQLSGRKGGMEVLMDIPLRQLCREEVARLREILMEYPSWRPVELRGSNGCLVSVSGYVDPDSAAELIDRIFREVLGLPESYVAEVELSIE